MPNINYVIKILFSLIKKKNIDLSNGRHIFLFCFVLTSCFNTKYLSYHEECNLYEYKNEPLRLPDKRLVTSSNIDTFLINGKINYLIFLNTKEKNYFIKPQDHVLVNSYNQIITSLNEKKYEESSHLCQNILNQYPSLFYFSDVNFLKGYAWAQMGKKDSAQKYLQFFLQYSEKKYPDNFWGHNDIIARQNYCMERVLAYQFLQTDSIFITNFQNIFPKYYFQSFSPGYVYNPQDYRFGRKFYYFFSLYENWHNNHLYGINVSYLFHKKVAITASLRMNKNMQLYNVFLPWEILGAKNNRWGIKLTPVVNFLKISENNYFATSTGISASYHFNIRYYISGGILPPALVQINKSPYFNTQIWYVLIGAHLWKNISLASMYKNKDIITGVLINNLIIGHQWQKNQFYIGLVFF